MLSIVINKFGKVKSIYLLIRFIDMELENHGEISAKVAERRLRRRDPVIGNYLIRHFGKDLIISYLDVHYQMKHALIPFAKNCTFRQQNPNLTTREDILLELSRLFYMSHYSTRSHPQHNSCSLAEEN